MKKIVPNDAILIPDQAKKVFGGVIFDVYQWEQSLYDGSAKTFEMLKRPDSVTVLAIVDGKLLVLDEEQSHRGFKRTFPTGRVEADETALDAAKRETYEETGYEFSNWRLVHVVQPQAKLEWFVSSYVAWGVTSKRSPQLDAGEKVIISLCNFEESKQVVEDDKYYLMETYEIFQNIKSIAKLCDLPEFKGKEVDR